MKILYFHQYFTTPKGSGGVRSYEFARRWVAAGHTVHVVTGTAYDRTLPVNGNTCIDGIHITTVGVGYSTEMGFVARLKSFLLYAFKAAYIALHANGYDVVLASSTPLTVAIPAVVAKWVSHRKVIFEVRDVWPDAAIDAGVLKNPLLIFLARLLEKAAYLSSNHIVPLSIGMQARLRRKGVGKDRMTMIPNCSDISFFEEASSGPDLRKEYLSEDKFLVLYVGAVNVANNIDYVVEVAELLKPHRDIEIWIVGEGNRFEHLRNEIRRRELLNVMLHGLQPKNRIPQFTLAADVGLVTFIPQDVYYENSPNKFFDYIAAGLPVLFNRSTWLEVYLNKYMNGYICDPFNPQTMVDRILEIKNDPGKKTRMGVKSKKLAEDMFSRDKMADKYLRLMNSL